jgi:hypothetical protein
MKKNGKNEKGKKGKGTNAETKAKKDKQRNVGREKRQ